MKQVLNKIKSMVLCFNKKGSFTVEASIVFSLVFLLMVVLVYCFIIMYQYISLQSAASEASNRGAAYYVKQFKSNSQWPPQTNLYWRIFDSDTAVKKSSIETYTLTGLEPSIINSGKTAKIDTHYSLLINQLKVGIEENYPLPAGKLLAIFGISPQLAIRAEISTPLEDNAEFVRNLDMVIDIKNCMVNSDNKWIGTGSEVNEIIGKLLKKH